MPSRDALRELLVDIAADPAAGLTIPAVAARLSVGIRHVTRLFLRQLDAAPGAYRDRFAGPPDP